MTTNQTAAFFDLDGTLFDGYVWRALQRSFSTLAVVADRLRADGAVGTPRAQRDGRYLGKITSPLSVGPGKAARQQDSRLCSRVRD